MTVLCGSWGSIGSFSTSGGKKVSINRDLDCQNRWLCRLVVLVLLLTVQGYAQDRFWNTETTLTVAAITAATGVDAYTTNRGFENYHEWHEANPLIPRARAGRVGYFAGTYVVPVAGAWLLYRAGHPRLAKWVLRVHLGVETQAAIYTGLH